MGKGKTGKLLALLLSLALMLSSQSLAFAEDTEPATEPAEPEEPEVHLLIGTVYQYGYSESESSGKEKSGAEVKITLNGSETTLTSDSDGKIEYTFEDDTARTEDGTYSYSIDADDEHYAATGTIKEDEEAKIYLRERYTPTASDYKFVESDDVKIIGSDTWVKAPGTYQIEGTSGKKLSESLDGDEADKLSVTVGADGSIGNFFIYIADLCSKVLTGQSVKVDGGAPEVTSVTTEPANALTFVKEHGVYGKSKADLLLNTSIKEDSSIKEVYMVSVPADEEEPVRYDATKVEGKNGQYSVSIGLPGEETILDAQLVKLVAVDVFGNKSNEVLIQQTENGSKVTLEQIAPKITKSDSGKKSSYGWYSEMPNLAATASDTLSGLASLKISGEGYEIAKAEYTDKVTDEKSVSGFASAGADSADGSYTYTVEATDNSGNTASEDIKVKIDLVKPEVSAEGVKSGEHYNSNPVIQISEKETYYTEVGNRIFVTVQRDGKTILDNTYTGKNAVTVPAETFAQDGVYSVAIYAKDAADNESNHLSYSFIKDATAPKVSISGVKEDKFYNKAQTVTVTVVEHNYPTDEVSVSAVKKLGNAKKNMGFPWKNKGEETTNKKTYSETGTYTVTASAKDKAGNQSKTKKVSFTIDTKAPVINITGVRDGGVYTYGQGLSPNATVTDDYLASKSITFTKAGQPVSNPNFEQLKENDGLYTMTVTATDKAGNSARKQISFVVNRFGSWFEYNDAIKNLQGKAVQNVESDLVITERNVSRVTESDPVIYKDEMAAGKGKTSADEAGAEKVYRHVFAAADFAEEGAYEINVRSKDEVGNEMESREENGLVKFFVDRTAPTITLSGIDPKGNQAESITVDIKAADTLTGVSEVKATIDGEPVTVNEQSDGDIFIKVGEGLRQKVVVTATDGAGNKAETDAVASVSTNKALLFLNRFGLIIGAVAAALTGLLIWLLARRRKDDDEEDETESNILD